MIVRDPQTWSLLGDLIAQGGGGGGGGDASAANQVIANGILEEVTAELISIRGQGELKNSVGGTLPLDFGSLPETYGYTIDALTTIARTNGTNTWTKTLTYTSGRLTAISAWVQS